MTEWSKPSTTLALVRLGSHLPLDQTQAKALEMVALDKLVQIHRQALKGNAQMISKVKVIRHLYGMKLVLWVPFHQFF